MKKEVIKTNQAPRPAGAYSQGIKAGNFVFTASEGPIDPRSGEVAAPGNVREQTIQTLKNIEAILKKAGTSLDNVVKMTAYIRSEDWAEFNGAYKDYFKEDPPARSIVETLHTSNKMRVGLDAIAIIPDNSITLTDRKKI